METDKLIKILYKSINSPVANRINKVWCDAWERGGCTDKSMMDSAGEMAVCMAEVLIENL